MTFVVEGQVFMPYTDAGFFAGGAYYLGDVNTRRQFYSPGLAFGATVKHNFTEHHSLRVAAFWGQLQGDDLDFANEYQQSRAHSFETTLLDVNVGHEFNFMPYITYRRLTMHSTYMFASVGYSIVMSSSTGMAANHFTIPFGIGYKYRFNERVTTGLEWGMRKTFTDSIDGLLNPGLEDAYAATHNNDWYSFFGAYITFRVFEKNFKCPGITEQRTYR